LIVVLQLLAADELSVFVNLELHEATRPWALISTTAANLPGASA
jgi:hypothetical protein